MKTEKCLLISPRQIFLIDLLLIFLACNKLSKVVEALQQHVRNVCENLKLIFLLGHSETFPQRKSSNYEKYKTKHPLNIFSNPMTIS